MPTTEDHYLKHTTESYESAYFYEPGPYQDFLTQKVLSHLALDQLLVQSDGDPKQHVTNRTLLDVGGGTGNFTQTLLDDPDSLLDHAVVLDPYLIPPSENSEDKSRALSFLQAPAESLAVTSDSQDDVVKKYPFHQALFKEVIHHLAKEDRKRVFEGIYHRVEGPSLVKSRENTDASSATTPTPVILIITRPQREIDYPLWDAAREVWAQNQPSEHDFSQELEAAGFTNIQSTLYAYPCAIALSRWQSMVRQRFWSTFAHFSDAELEAAIEALAASEKHRVDESGILHFEDRLVFLQASK